MTVPQNIFLSHNHRKCSASVIRNAERHCSTHGLRLTPVRRRVLEILLEDHRALGAYDILDRLKADGFGGQPPVVYRALEFLGAQGFVHKLNRLNAFTACSCPDSTHESLFLICDDCRQVAEAPLDALEDQIDLAAGAMGFDVGSRAVEVVGRCASCREAVPR